MFVLITLVSDSAEKRKRDLLRVSVSISTFPYPHVERVKAVLMHFSVCVPGVCVLPTFSSFSHSL